eukprot:2630852-Alexandrium_andersonii.AAC.1
MHSWAARRQLVVVGADGPTRRNLRGGAPSRLGWAVVDEARRAVRPRTPAAALPGAAGSGQCVSAPPAE